MEKAGKVTRTTVLEPAIYKLCAVGRRRLHEEESILDAAEALLAERGGEGLTIRALSEATGASTGSLYHAFGSRAELLGRMWLRGAEAFLDLLDSEIDKALRGPTRGRGERAILAAASVLATLERDRPQTARLLIGQSREALLGEGLSAPLARSLLALDDRLGKAIRHLATARWGAADNAAIDTVRICVVDLPGALLGADRRRAVDPERVLAAAVKGVLAGDASGGRRAKNRRAVKSAGNAARSSI